jgi:hypothetical protein
MTKESVADVVACHGGRLRPLANDQTNGGMLGRGLGRHDGCIAALAKFAKIEVVDQNPKR